MANVAIIQGFPIAPAVVSNPGLPGFAKQAVSPSSTNIAFTATLYTKGNMKGVLQTASAVGAALDMPILNDILLGAQPEIQTTRGASTGLAAYIAVEEYQKHKGAYDLANRTGDTSGQALSGMGIVKAGSQFVAGTATLTHVPLSIVATRMGINTGYRATTALGKAAFGIGVIASAFFGIYYVMMTARSALSLHKIRVFRNAFFKHKTEAERLRFMQKQLEVNLDALTQKEKDKLMKETIGHLADVMVKLNKQPGSALPQGLTKEGWTTQLKNMIAGKDTELLTMAVTAKKQAELARIIGKDAVLKVINGNIEAVAAADKVSKTNRNLHIAVVVLGIFCILGTAIGFAFGWPAAVAIGAILSVIILAMMFATDGYSLHGELKKGATATDDDMWRLKFQRICGIVLSTVGIVLTGVFSGGIVPLAIGIVLGLAWLGLDTYVIDTLDKNNREAMKNNPTLEYLVKILGDSNFREKDIKDIYEKLQDQFVAAELELSRQAIDRFFTPGVDKEKTRNDAFLIARRALKGIRQNQMTQDTTPLAHVMANRADDVVKAAVIADLMKIAGQEMQLIQPAPTPQ